MLYVHPIKLDLDQLSNEQVLQKIRDFDAIKQDPEFRK